MHNFDPLWILRETFIVGASSHPQGCTHPIPWLAILGRQCHGRQQSSLCMGLHHGSRLSESLPKQAWILECPGYDRRDHEFMSPRRHYPRGSHCITIAGPAESSTLIRDPLKCSARGSRLSYPQSESKPGTVRFDQPFLCIAVLSGCATIEIWLSPSSIALFPQRGAD